MAPTAVKEMKTNYSWQTVNLQRSYSEKRQVEMEKLLNAFHNPDDGDKRHWDYETAQKLLPFLSDIAVHQLVLNL